MDREERKALLRDAEACLRRCMRLDPADPRTYVVLGKTMLTQKRFDEARRLYSEGTAGERGAAGTASRLLPEGFR